MEGIDTKMNFRTYENLTDCIIKNLYKVPRDIDLIVGIPRSGTMVANILALYLNLPFTDIENFLKCGSIKTGSTRKCRNWIKRIEDAEHVLIVDDSISSGKAISEVKERLKGRKVSYRVTYLVVYALALSCKKADIYFELCEQPRMFEWNYMHHWALEYCCMDIDGVICEDPAPFQNDDGTRYLDFIKNAPPKFIPTQKVGYLVSCRLEKYRKDTEVWLEKYSVDYGELILVQNITAKERAIHFDHAKYKAEIYKKTKCFLFFESDYDQALEICQLSGKPVFCVGRRELLTSNNVYEKMKNRQREWKVTLKRVVRKVLNKIDYVK